LARGIEDCGYTAGYNVLLCNSDRSITKELAYLDMLISKRIDGLVYMTTDTHSEQLQPLLDRNIPVVTYDREYEAFDAILLDNFQGGYDATRHLIGLGHRRIACIAGPDSRSGRSAGRTDGYRQALEDAGLPVDPSLIARGSWTYESGRDAARRFFELASPPTAIFACNDTMAIGVVAYLTQHGLDVPGDVSVVGFDNITLSAFISPPLTTLATSTVELGQRLCQMLLQRIGGKLPPEPQRYTVTGELVIRFSTAPANEGARRVKAVA
ncbi:MAG TPA: substrate-binding domain-containing protein, partial [Ardenticatenaceae bacterium]|nr:substrate-binding domain-containing protein [Ardenticatenaceae bacterium]